MNDGKRFEQDFEASVPEDAFILRLKDAGGWGDATNLRFTPKNLCDFVLFIRGQLYLLELKSYHGVSIPGDQIRQLADMLKIDKPFVKPCLVLNYRDKGVTYLLPVKEAERCLKDRKSIPISFCEERGHIIKQVLKKTRYRYVLERM